MMDIMLSLNSSNTHGYHLTHDETLLIKKAMIKTKIEREGKWVRGKEGRVWRGKFGLKEEK